MKPLIRFETRLSEDLYRELEDLSRVTGVSSAGLARLAVVRLLANRTVLVNGPAGPVVAAPREGRA
jgi:hypothetical protein